MNHVSICDIPYGATIHVTGSGVERFRGAHTPDGKCWRVVTNVRTRYCDRGTTVEALQNGQFHWDRR